MPDKEALWRIAYRSNEDRSDDKVDAIKKRIEIFHKITKPVIDFYQKKGKLEIVDGRKTIQQIHKEILKNLGKQIVKNRLKEWEQNDKTIMAITGLAGSGKTIASEYLKSKGIPVIHFGNIINDYVDEKKLNHTEDIHKKIRADLRKKYGMSAMAILSKNKIEQALKKERLVIIDGLYSYEEFTYLQNEFKDVKIYILAIWADKKIRYERVSKRKKRGELRGEARDLNEVISSNKGPTIALADYLVINDTTIEEFTSKLEYVYREIYFS